jgi:hypothetical protein
MHILHLVVTLFLVAENTDGSYEPLFIVMIHPKKISQEYQHGYMIICRISQGPCIMALHTVIKLTKISLIPTKSGVKMKMFSFLQIL